MSVDYSHLYQLGVAEKLQLVEDLWDSIAEGQEPLPLLDWQKEELRRRKEWHLKNPDAGSSWKEVKQRIRDSNA